ncbi:MAG TPA: PspC domain-containing protein [Candidatus Acidoferrum sp.]|nr:PspC domain-containing protein [Candidatus Acidoferrum sp.]
MVCNSCQKVIMDGSSFCYNCGAKQSGAPQAGPVPTPTPAQHSRGKLMRSSTDKKLGGVCAGVGNYLDLDVTLVRVLWVLAFFCGGTGLLLYIILWIVLPVEPMYVPVAAQSAPTP